MTQFIITGMSCAACSARVEKAIKTLDGVSQCSVNLLTNTLTVEGTASTDAIIKAVTDAGYGARLKDETKKPRSKNVEDLETPKLIKGLILSVVLVVVLMYFSMGYTMWGLPVPRFLEGNPWAIGLIELFLCTWVMIINRQFFIRGFKGIINRAPNMDTLVSLGSAAGFVYSVAIMYELVSQTSSPHHLLHQLYFESSAMILTLISLGKMLESRSKGKTTNALKELMDLAPKTALVLIDGIEKEVPIEELKAGDIFIIKAGMYIPTDGEIIDGQCSVDESALTGESIPNDKGKGDTVSAGTINKSGYAKCIATKIGEDTTLQQIIKMVSDASSTKAPISKLADKVSGIFVPLVILIGLITVIVWLIAGHSLGYALARGISVLVISCPCALGLATPVAVMVSSGMGAKSGILFKTAAAIEETGRIEIVALDKTGTITSGTPKVTDVFPANIDNKDMLIKYAYALESKSEHPLGEAMVKYAKENNVPLLICNEFETLAGNGVAGVIDNRKIFGGSLNFISSKVEVSEDIIKKADCISNEGATPVLFSSDEEVIGIISIADTIKEDSKEAIEQLKSMGIEVVMLTGDNEKTANAIKQQSGIDKVIAGVMPGDKAIWIEKLKQTGKTAMVGDGINDAPALTSAHVGIAIGNGTDIAIESADVVLINSRLTDVCAAIRLGRRTLQNIRQNLFWAFVYNIIGIPLAAGVFIKLTGWEINPMFGAAAMSLSSFCVVTNALRLNLTDIHRHKTLRKRKETKKMEITMNIEGMMCMHCEARVKKLLESIDGITEVTADHNNNTAKVKMNKEVPFDVLKKAVENEGYTVK